MTTLEKIRAEGITADKLFERMGGRGVACGTKETSRAQLDIFDAAVGELAIVTDSRDDLTAKWRKASAERDEARTATEQYRMENKKLQEMWGGSGWAREKSYLESQLAAMTARAEKADCDLYNANQRHKQTVYELVLERDALKAEKAKSDKQVRIYMTSQLEATRSRADIAHQLAATSALKEQADAQALALAQKAGELAGKCDALEQRNEQQVKMIHILAQWVRRGHDCPSSLPGRACAALPPGNCIDCVIAEAHKEAQAQTPGDGYVDAVCKAFPTEKQPPLYPGVPHTHQDWHLICETAFARVEKERPHMNYGDLMAIVNYIESAMKGET